jgi:hypothetical protein
MNRYVAAFHVLQAVANGVTNQRDITSALLRMGIPGAQTATCIFLLCKLKILVPETRQNGGITYSIAPLSTLPSSHQ